MTEMQKPVAGATGSGGMREEINLQVISVPQTAPADKAPCLADLRCPYCHGLGLKEAPPPDNLGYLVCERCGVHHSKRRFPGLVVALPPARPARAHADGRRHEHDNGKPAERAARKGRADLF